MERMMGGCGQMRGNRLVKERKGNERKDFGR